MRSSSLVGICRVTWSLAAENHPCSQLFFLQKQKGKYLHSSPPQYNQRRAMASKNVQGYQGVNAASGFTPDVVVDLRSDTVTLPSKGMREAIANAALGDDIFGEDPTTNEFEKRVAELLGKEAALLVTSGTQGNLISALVQCDVRGSEMISGTETHTFRYEQGNVSQFGGIHSCQIPTNPNGTFDLNILQERFRGNDMHYPITKLVCIENTNNRCGGRILPLEWIDELGKICKEHKIPIHMDGARLFNAAVATGVPAKRIVRDMASVSICFSKGLGAPAGSAIAGSRAFVEQARRMRKALGGGMRQNGILAACGLYCLDHMIDRLKDDHDNARLIVDIINSKNMEKVYVDAAALETNIIVLRVKDHDVQDFCSRMQTVSNEKEERAQLDGKSVSVKCFPTSPTTLRLVTHCDITKEMARLAALKICFVGEEISGSR